MTSETELTGLTTPELRRELQRLEKQRDRLLNEFPYLRQLSGPPSVISQYTGESRTPERVLFYDLRRRIRSLKVELVRRDEDVGTAPGETATPRHKKRGRRPDKAVQNLKDRIVELFKMNRGLTPKELAGLPVLKDNLETSYKDPANFVSKTLAEAKKDGRI